MQACMGRMKGWMQACRGGMLERMKACMVRMQG